MIPLKSALLVIALGIVVTARAEAGEPLRTFFGHRMPAVDLQVAADHPDTFVTASWDKTVKLWRLDRDAPVWTAAVDNWEEPQDTLIAHLGNARFSPDGTKVAVVGIKIFALVDANDGHLLRFFPIGNRRPESVAFSHDGRFLATGDTFDTIVWNAETGRVVASFPADRRFPGVDGYCDPPGCWWPAVALRFSDDGRHLVTVSYAYLTVRDILTGEVVQQLAVPGNQPIGSPVNFGGSIADFSADLRYAAVGTRGQVVLFALESGRVIKTCGDENASEVNAVAFSLAQDALLTADQAGVLRYWDIASGALLRTFDTGRRGVRAAVIAPGALYVATSHADRTVNIWKTEDVLGTR